MQGRVNRGYSIVFLELGLVLPYFLSLFLFPCHRYNLFPTVPARGPVLSPKCLYCTCTCKFDEELLE